MSATGEKSTIDWSNSVALSAPMAERDTTPGSFRQLFTQVVVGGLQRVQPPPRFVSTLTKRRDRLLIAQLSDWEFCSHLELHVLLRVDYLLSALFTYVSKLFIQSYEDGVLRQGLEFEELFSKLINKHLCVDREYNILIYNVGWLQFSPNG